MYRAIVSVIFFALSSLAWASDSNHSLPCSTKFTAIAQQTAMIATVKQINTQRAIHALEVVLQKGVQEQLFQQLLKERIWESTEESKKLYEETEALFKECVKDDKLRRMKASLYRRSLVKYVNKKIKTQKDISTHPLKRLIFYETVRVCSEPDNLTDAPVCQWKYSEVALKTLEDSTADNT